MARVGEAQAEAALSFELETNKQDQTIIAEQLNVDLSKFQTQKSRTINYSCRSK